MNYIGELCEQIMSPPPPQFSQEEPQQGLTLIELSIVLVVIGLIVGGVLVGQDLIRAAELRGVVTYINQTDAAVHTYKGRYKALPGDHEKAYTFFAGGDDTVCGSYSLHATVPFSACNGDGDGAVENTRESVRAFHHMQLAGIIDYGLDPSRGDLIAVTHGEPGISLRKQWPDIIIPSLGLKNAGATMNAHAVYQGSYSAACAIGLYIGSQTGGGGNFTNDYRGTEALTPLDVINLESKMDDGLPDSGKMRTPNTWNRCVTDGEYDADKPGNAGCQITWCIRK